MDGVDVKKFQNPPPKTPKSAMETQIFLRILAAVASLAAAMVMLTNKQTVILYGIQAVAKYHYSSAFTFFAIANLVACVFSLVSVFVSGILSRNCSVSNKYFFLFLHDLVMTSFVMGACASATAIGFVGKYGSPRVGWMAICGDFVRFCDRVIISVMLSYFAFLVHLCITVISAKKSRVRNE